MRTCNQRHARAWLQCQIYDLPLLCNRPKSANPTFRSRCLFHDHMVRLKPAQMPEGQGAPGLCDAGAFEFAWIVDFPMFEYNEDEGRWEAAHHMFTMPQEEYHDSLESDPGAVKGDLYDLVLNGVELASGSIRIHDPDLQKRIFKIVGFDEEEGMRKFGFLTEAFKYGAPPHGGIAPGLDRLVMLMAGETSIKEVIAFPKNSFAVSPMDDCPSDVDEKQLEELHLAIVKKAD